MTLMKVCSHCRQTLPVTDFYAHKTAGHQHACKACQKVDIRQRRVVMSDRPRAERQVCQMCGVDKPGSEFTSDVIRKTGLFMWCKDCSRARHQQRMAALADLPKATEQTCRCCDVTKPADTFHNSIHTPTKLNIYCKGCLKLIRLVGAAKAREQVRSQAPERQSAGDTLLK